MKIAVTAETNNGLDSMVAQHFGHAPFFILVDMEDNEVCAVQTVANPFATGHQPGQIPGFHQRTKCQRDSERRHGRARHPVF